MPDTQPRHERPWAGLWHIHAEDGRSRGGGGGNRSRGTYGVQHDSSGPSRPGRLRFVQEPRRSVQPERHLVRRGLSASQLGTLATTNGGKGLSPAVANTIATGSVFVEVQTTNGKPLNDTSGAAAGNANLDLGLKVGSTTPLEVRIVDGSLFARVDADQLAADTGRARRRPPASKPACRMPTRWCRAWPPWPTTNGSRSARRHCRPCSTWPSSSAPQGQTGSANQSQYRAATSKLLSDIGADFESNSTVTTDGTHGSGTYYTVSVPIRPFAEQLATAVELPTLKSLPGGSTIASNLGSSLNQAVANNNQTLTLQVVVQDNQGCRGRPRRQPVPLRIAQGALRRTRTAEVRHPDGHHGPRGATELNLAKIPSLLGGMAQKSGTTSA